MLTSFDNNVAFFELKRLNGNVNSLVHCDTEYFPDDIKAVPAMGTIETIVTIAAPSGCDTISLLSESKYPTVRGPNSQLVFRDHPQLGLIANFQRFPGPRTFHQ